MCQLCDGASEDELRLDLARMIDTYGWAIQGVEATPASDPWAYTVGLVERYGQPEFVVTSVGFDLACRLLNELSDRVRDGQRFLPGDAATVGDIPVGFAAVHPGQLTAGLFAVWSDYYRALGHAGPQLTATQVLLPDSLFCGKHAHRMHRLDQPEPALGIARPNRAERRAHRRRQGRGRH
jgi:hypothetical protein